MREYIKIAITLQYKYQSSLLWPLNLTRYVKKQFFCQVEMQTLQLSK